VVVGSPDPGTLAPFKEHGFECLDARDAADLVNQVWSHHRCHVLAVIDAISIPPGFVARAEAFCADDLRVATVSFLSNDAAFLSFPNRNVPGARAPEGHDSESVSRLLRERDPVLEATPVPIATGAAVLVSSSALGAVGPFTDTPTRHFEPALADFCARARMRGFLHVADTSTFYARHRSAVGHPTIEVTLNGLDVYDNGWMHLRYPHEYEFAVREATSGDSPIGIALGLARAKVMGLRVLVDGTYLGPHEMGTQVSTVAIIDALAARDDVGEVAVLLSSDPPAYARTVLSAPKVRPVVAPGGDLSALGRFDVAHRPIQPDPNFTVARWRQAADRVVVTILDLIAYRIGSYHDSADAWLRYRASIVAGVRDADAVVVISHDVRHQVELERLPVDDARLCTVAFGTEHLRGDESATIPDELLARGFTAGEFVVCIGTDYTHKNRDLALATVAELRRRGWNHALVMAGPTVPYGSSLAAEASASLSAQPVLDDGVFLLPDLPSAGRNWLFRHASLVLYPTSAEGFGFVPYEAARFGTPTLFVGFGPLSEVAPDVPVVAKDWRPESLASAAEALLTNATVAEGQVRACLDASTTYTWPATAASLTALYRRTLAMPAR